jgi:hypothetical protein
MLLFVPIAGAASNVTSIEKAELYKAPENTTTENDLFTELSEKAELYNQNFNEVPGILKRLVSESGLLG